MSIIAYLGSINGFLFKAIKDLCTAETFDIVQVEFPYPFLPSYLSKIFSIKTHVVLDEHNVDFLQALSKFNTNVPSVKMAAGLYIPYVFITELFAVKKSDIILSVSEKDAKNLSSLYRVNKGKIWVVPNGVDISLFNTSQKSSKEKLFGTSKKVVFFHGSLSWLPNLEAANIILDVIAPRIFDAYFVICGRFPPASFLRKISKAKNVKYGGYVSNIAEYICNSDVCIAPILRGGGTKLKLLEYAAAGKPIVATHKAIEGLPFVNAVHALLFKDVEEDFINAIKKVLLDDAFAEKLGSNAKQLALKFDWKEIGSKLYDKYASLLSQEKK
jgi:glycosyltransferase involved in cell wall biosynthesis